MSVLEDLRLPVVGAPMAGGVSTPALVAAVCEAGGLGVLAGGQLPVEQLAALVVQVQDLTDRPFGVNLFVPAPVDRERHERAVAAYRRRLEPDARLRGVDLPVPDWRDTDGWEDKVALVQVLGVAVVSCTFGAPPAEVVRAWQRSGCEVHVGVTTAAEAQEAARRGVDALVVQGAEAGGHRTVWDPEVRPNRLDHLGLLEVLRPIVDLPLVAAGGITTAGDTRRALATGASAVQVGTALLLSDEAGTSVTTRAGLRDPALTTRVVTRAFTGRCAGAVRNAFVQAHDDATPAAYPVIDQVTRPLRQAAADAGDVSGVHLWAGTGWRAAQEGSAAEIVGSLAP